ncbi:MAG: hypothetical protein KGJ98_05680 [Chloroflexota bacterium]|nr:hypothetical protein [Chloroflexota bacterium]
MSDRGVAIAAGAALLAVVIAGFLFVGAMGAAGQSGAVARPRLFFGTHPPAAARTVEQIQSRLPVVVRPLVPMQRSVAVAAHDAASYVLLLLGVAAVVVFAREQVVACYRASLGGWRAVLRVALLGIALLALIASAAFLSFVVLLGSFARAAGTARVIGGGGLGVATGLVQFTVTAMAAGLLIVTIVTLVGFAGSAWRLADILLSTGPGARIAQAAPSPLIAVAGATLIYLLAQLPIVGAIIAIIAVAYGLGSAAAARLGHTTSAI